ncbi:hypothetical protein BH11ARM1_BH11ARM1_15490 [soil metagenome]
MDFLPIAFLILFVILGGVIAVIADNVGRTLGKKKLRIGKLRPRHTAMIGTFIVGSLISIFTILLVTVVSSDVRQWIIEGRRAVQQRDNALRDLHAVEGDLVGQKREYTKLDHDYKEKAAEVNKQAGKLQGLQDQITKLTPRIQQLQSAMAVADTKIRKLNAEQLKTQHELADKKAELTKAQSDVALVEKERKKQENLAKTAAQQKNESDVRNQELTHANEVFENNIAGLKTDIERLKSDTVNIDKARSKAQDELDQASASLQEYQTKLATAQSNLDAVAAEYRRLRSAVDQIAGPASQARTEPVVYQVGEEITRLPADGGMSVRQAEDTLSSLLRSARVAANTRGAKASAKAPEAGLTPQSDPATKELISSEILARRIVQQIASSKEPVVLIAFASLNSFRNEPVFLEVQILPDPQLYAKGDVIAESRIDGHKDEDSILKQLEDLVSIKVRERAKGDKMIPKMGSDQFGEVSPVEIYKVLGQIKDSDRTVRVQALAAQETRAGDPLKLTFRIR